MNDDEPSYFSPLYINNKLIYITSDIANGGDSSLIRSYDITTSYDELLLKTPLTHYPVYKSGDLIALSINYRITLFNISNKQLTTLQTPFDALYPNFNYDSDTVLFYDFSYKIYKRGISGGSYSLLSSDTICIFRKRRF
ncbi:MAG: hypothetical protein M0D57_10495 [Sphingobacteriales bacterium JAD_PAG50586_3]|nr:MAG: hypothetical protein M0D57_10495 [Sphingobacteriales bacterium JAD_PAG50586_3]